MQKKIYLIGGIGLDIRDLGICARKELSDGTLMLKKEYHLDGISLGGIAIENYTLSQRISPCP